jgi:hypothetical protein
MKHVTTADKSLLIGDEAAELLISYAALLGQQNSADDVTLSAWGADGDPVEVTFLLNAGTTLLVESSESTVPEPDNREAIVDLKERMRRITSPPLVQPERDGETVDATSEWDD